MFYQRPVFNVAEKLRVYAPAISAIAFENQIITASEIPGVENDLLVTASTLLALFEVYMKKKNLAKIDRLIIETQVLILLFS
uniref:Uncharacterized protein n=1 Tax=Panagrolaimus superbus TaxID=310955 RepID=A0A914YMG4_9BILA